MVEIQLAFAGTGTAAKDTTSYVICLFVSLDQWICYENRPYFPFVGVDVHRSGKWSHVARFTSINEPVRMS